MAKKKSPEPAPRMVPFDDLVSLINETAVKSDEISTRQQALVIKDATEGNFATATIHEHKALLHDGAQANSHYLLEQILERWGK